MDNTSRFKETDGGSGPSRDSVGKPDTEYYFNIVVFKAENTIFRVPRDGFDVPGTIFETMFSLPVDGVNTQGSNDRNPIILPVSEEYFRGFLRALYAINGRELTETDWLGALDLSTMWMFIDIRRRAIEALDRWIKRRSAKEAVLLAKKYRITKWLTDAYTRILRQQTFTANELVAPPFSLDWETIAKLISARETIRIRVANLHNGSLQLCNCRCCRSTSRNNSYYNAVTPCGCRTTFQANTDPTPTSADLMTAITNEFKEELEIQE